MAYRNPGEVAPRAPRMTATMRRVGRAFDLIVGLMVAGFVLAAGLVYSRDTLSCRREAGGAARCELSRSGLFGRSAALDPSRPPDLRVAESGDEAGSTTLVFSLAGGGAESVQTTASRGRDVIAAHRAFTAGERAEVSIDVSRMNAAVSALLAAVGLMVAGVALAFPRGARVSVFDDGGVEVETLRPLRASARASFSAASISELRVDPQDDGELAHLVFVIDGAPRRVFTGLPGELERAREALAPVIARLRGKG